MPSADKPGLSTRGKKGGGLFLVNHKGESVVKEKLLSELLCSAKEVIWSKTQQTLQPYL